MFAQQRTLVHAVHGLAKLEVCPPDSFVRCVCGPALSLLLVAEIPRQNSIWALRLSSAVPSLTAHELTVAMWATTKLELRGPEVDALLNVMTARCLRMLSSLEPGEMANALYAVSRRYPAPAPAKGATTVTAAAFTAEWLRVATASALVGWNATQMTSAVSSLAHLRLRAEGEAVAQQKFPPPPQPRRPTEHKAFVMLWAERFAPQLADATPRVWCGVVWWWSSLLLRSRLSALPRT